MLTPPDEKLAKRDRALPGLAVLLDPDAFSGALRRSLSGLDVGHLQQTYIRYKPATSCLVGYLAAIGGALTSLYAITYNPQNEKKLSKARQRMLQAGPFGPRNIVFEDCPIAVCIFPNDNELKALCRLASPKMRENILEKVIPHSIWANKCEFKELRYKPQRRYVAQLCNEEGLCAALKVYTQAGYLAAHRGAKAFSSKGRLRIPKLLGSSDAYCLQLFEWLSGQPLKEAFLAPGWDDAVMRNVGAALLELHTQQTNGLPVVSRQEEAESIFTNAKAIGALCPELERRAQDAAGQLTDFLHQELPVYVSVHGDFYAKQVLINKEEVIILDLDRSAYCEPALDLGSFNAYLEQYVIYGGLSSERKENLWQEFLSGYQVRDSHVHKRISGYTAIGLLRRSAEPFRYRQPNWPHSIELLLSRAEEYLQAHTTISVSASFDISFDPEMPFLKAALDPLQVKDYLYQCLLYAQGKQQQGIPMQLKDIRVIRYKPGRRCLIEYDVGMGLSQETISIVGKVRAKGLDIKTYELQVALWNKGFSGDSADGISIPEPIGTIPQFNMCLYRKVPGIPAAQLLLGPQGGLYLARRIAQAAYKIHTCNVSASKRHTIQDELAILHERLLLVVKMKPEWGRRITNLLELCEELAKDIPEGIVTGIYRDFYAEQILVDKDRLYLVDMDLYCNGDPALDIGNFIGHLKELSLRAYGNADALAQAEHELRDEFLRLSNRVSLASIEIYTTLTLVRHIYLSAQFPERQSFTETLLRLCEKRIEAYLNGNKKS